MLCTSGVLDNVILRILARNVTGDAKRVYIRSGAFPVSAVLRMTSWLHIS